MLKDGRSFDALPSRIAYGTDVVLQRDRGVEIRNGCYLSIYLYIYIYIYDYIYICIDLSIPVVLCRACPIRAVRIPIQDLPGADSSGVPWLDNHNDSCNDNDNNKEFHIDVYIYIYVYTHTHAYIDMHVYIYIYRERERCLCMYVCMCTYIYIYIYMGRELWDPPSFAGCGAWQRSTRDSRCVMIDNCYDYHIKLYTHAHTHTHTVHGLRGLAEIHHETLGARAGQS